MVKDKRSIINSALYKLKRNNKDCQYINMSNLIKGGLRVSIELGNDRAIEVERKARGNIESKLVKRYFVNGGNMGGFSIRVEDATKTTYESIPDDYNHIQSLVIQTIKSI